MIKMTTCKVPHPHSGLNRFHRSIQFTINRPSTSLQTLAIQYSRILKKKKNPFILFFYFTPDISRTKDTPPGQKKRSKRGSTLSNPKSIDIN